MSVPHQFSLRWNNYNQHITSALDSLRSQEDLVDVTLSCEGRKIRAHKILLSACSNYFRDVFKENPCQHPVIIFKNVKYEDLTAIIEFMYQGEVNVVQESLPSFLHTAELLAVQGLTENKEQQTTTSQSETITLPKLTKIVPLAIQTTPSTNINTAHINFTASPLQQPIIFTKKPKLTAEKEQQHIVDTSDEIEFEQPTAVKMEMSEFINMTGNEVNPNNSDVQIQTDDEILHQNDDDDEDDDKNLSFMQEDNYEIENESDGGGIGGGGGGGVGDGGGDKEQMDIEDLKNDGEIDETNEQGVRFRNRTELQKSDELLSQNRWSQCQFCKLVITTANLWRHIRTQHTSQPPIRCENCKKKFKNKYSLREHVRMAHEHKKSNLTLQTTNDEQINKQEQI